MNRRTLLSTVGAGVTTALAGCTALLGGGSTLDEDEYDIGMSASAFDPVTYEATVGETVTWGNTSQRSHTVTGVEERTDGVTLTVRGPDGEFDVEAKMVAGCDGPRSRVRSELGLPDPEEFLHGVLAFDPEPDDQDFVDVHLTVPGFFAWRIPRGPGGVEYGLAAAPSADGDVAERFDALVEEYGVADRIEHRCSGLIPIGPPSSVTSHRGFLVGDAGGMTKPFTGGGILYGMTAADCAARTIDPDAPETLAEYESAWRDELETEIKLGKLIRKGYDAPELVQRAGMKLFEGEIGVHMDKPTSVFSVEQVKSMLR